MFGITKPPPVTTPGQALSALRGALGMTQEDFATELSMSQENVSRIERATDVKMSTIQPLDPTGAYRMFFRFGRIGNRRIAAVGHGRKKNREAFPRSVIDLAQRKVDAFLADLGVDGFVDPD